ncbi:unnamed protein product, partial [Polarella glacialis]
VVLLDFPRAASWIYTMVKPLIPPKTSGKIVLLSRRDPAGIEAYLKEACGDNDTIQMLEKLLQMNHDSTTKTGPESSHLLTSSFLKRQLAALSVATAV